MKPHALTLLFLFTATLLFSQNPGELWGVTASGGTDGLGNIYKTDTDGNWSVEYSFAYGNPGGRPYYTTLIEATNGKLYGLTSEGGAESLGVIFEYDPSTATYSKKIDFNSSTGAQPFGSLLKANDGKLYGMTRYGGANNIGTIFSYDPATNVHTKLFDFAGANSGAEPTGSLMQLPNGKVYGMARLGGTNGLGTIFEFDITTNTFSKKYDFAGSNDGSEPLGHLTLAANDKLYGMTLSGGLSNYGTIFEFDPSTNAYVKRFDFGGSVGQLPQGSLYNASNGKLYGMTYQGGANNLGVLFEYDPVTNIHTVKYNMSLPNGGLPYGSLTQAANGKLWGLTLNGGDHAGGTLFEYDVTSNTFTRKFNFGITKNGSSPGGAPLIASNGKIYGLTLSGGSSNTNAGTLFEFDPANGDFRNLHFKNMDNGVGPNGGMILVDGKFYGMTNYGGTDASGVGVLYEYDPVSKAYTVKFNFDDINGSYPAGNSLTYVGGKIYGTTTRGGNNNTGVLFEYDLTTETLTKKADFVNTNGRSPVGQLVQAANGKLYGTTSSGGAIDEGVIFEYDLSGTLTVAYDFIQAVGSYPTGSLTLLPNGEMYGLTEFGGANDKGVIFEFDPSDNSYQRKYDFNTEGENPDATMVVGANQKLYGFTTSGGLNDEGVLFEFDPSTSTYTKKIDINSNNEIGQIHATLSAACNNKLYATSSTGGPDGFGQFFEFDPATGIYTPKKDLTEDDGMYSSRGGLVLWPSPTVISSSGGMVCGSGSAQLMATPASGTINWYATGTGGSALASGGTFASPSITSTTTYYAEAFMNGCASDERTAVVATVNATPTVTATEGARCDAGSVTLSATSDGSISWFNVATGGSALASGNNYATPDLDQTTSFYAEAELNGCKSPRSEVVAMITILPKPVITVTDNNTVLTSSAPSGNQWYLDDEPIASATSATYVIADAGVYTVRTTINDCASEFSDATSIIVTGLEKAGDVSISVYPNPAKEELVIGLSGFSGSGSVSIKLVDMLGRTVYDGDGTAGQHARIDIRHFKTGEYVILMQQDNYRVSRKFIKSL